MAKSSRSRLSLDWTGRAAAPRRPCGRSEWTLVRRRCRPHGRSHGDTNPRPRRAWSGRQLGLRTAFRWPNHRRSSRWPGWRWAERAGSILGEGRGVAVPLGSGLDTLKLSRFLFSDDTIIIRIGSYPAHSTARFFLVALSSSTLPCGSGTRLAPSTRSARV